MSEPMTVLMGHQPLFVGTAEWWSRVAAADVFVLSDDVDYEPKSAQSRHVLEGIMRTLPVRHVGLPQSIAETRVAWDDRAYQKLFRSLNQAWKPKREYPWGGVASGILMGILLEGEAHDWPLGAVTVRIAQEVHAYLGLTSRLVAASSLSLPMDDGLPSGPTSRIVRQCVALGAGQYWCGASGAEYLALELFAQRGVKVYEVGYDGEYGDVPVLDLIAWHGPAAKELIGSCRPSRSLGQGASSAAAS